MSQSALVTQNQGFLATLPIGVILAWHRDLAPNSYMPSLPAGWVACDGQTLDDPESPLHGQAIPDLNKQARFLRGGETSGALQDDQIQSHKHSDMGHSHSDAGHTHTVELSNNTSDGPDVWVQHADPQGGNWGGSGTSTGLAAIQQSQAQLGDPVSCTAGPARHGAETRPINMSVVWIIKVKHVVSARAVPAVQAHPDAPLSTLYVCRDGQVGLGTQTPNERAALHIESSTRGALLPRMSTAERLTIADPPEGLEVYDTDAHAKFYYNGSRWLELRSETIIRGTVLASGGWVRGSPGVTVARQVDPNDAHVTLPGVYVITTPKFADVPVVVVTGYAHNNNLSSASDNVFIVANVTTIGFKVYSKDIAGSLDQKYQDAPFSFIAIG